MKVAVVSPYALDRHGGVQSHSRQLAAHLVERGLDAVLIGPGGGPSGEGEIHIGGAVSIPANRSKAPISLSPVAAVRLRRALAGADVVHVHEPWVPLVGWVAQMAGVPTVLTFHADPSRRVLAAYRRLAGPLRAMVGRAAAVTAVSAQAAAAIEPFCADPAIIPNAVDVNPAATTGDRGPTVAFVGRDEDRKGLSIALAAWPDIRRRVPEASLKVVSDTDRAMPEGAELLSDIDDAAKLELLGATAVFVAPNTGGESFGITIAEAMAAGCAVVASDIAAFVDLLDGAGLHAAVGDSAALAGQVVRLLTDGALLRSRSEAARSRVAVFTWDSVVPKYLELYRAALA